jgi:hypothetical protein
VQLRIRSCVRALSIFAALTFLSAALCAGAEPLSRMTFTRGWATFGLTLPPGAARSGVRVGTLPTQTDVKVRWPDGSIRFAVVSTKIPSAGTFPITSTASPVGGASGAMPPLASVVLTIQGKQFTAAALPFARGDAWLAGPLVTEQRSIVAPGLHPFLRVIFDVRTYADGASRIDVTVENCLDTEAADQVVYDVAVSVNRRPVFQQSGITHKYLSRWRKVFAASGLSESAVTPDLESTVAAQALPAFLSTVGHPVRSLTGTGVSGTGFDILDFGDLMVPMDSHGGRPELAPYPDWTAEYLVHKLPAQREYVLRHGELAGSWGVHVRNPDGSMPSLDAPDQAYYWLDPRWKENGFSGPRGQLAHRAQQGDIAHQPSLAFVPYLLTGDRFFADEMAFWANFTLIGSFASDDNRKGAQGLLIGNEVRGIGWGLRNLGDAAAYLPDDNPMKHYLASKVWNNLAYLDDYAATFDSGPVQTLFPGRRPEDTVSQYQPYMWISLWEQSYVAWALDHVMAHGPVAGYNFSTGGSKLRNRIARLQLALFTGPGWPRASDRQAPYLVAAGKWSKESPPRVEYFRSLAEVAAATFSVPSPAAPDFVRAFEGNYGPEARLMLMICQRLRDGGADAGLAAIMSDSKDGVSMIADLNKRAGWAIAPTVVPQS